MTARVIDLGQMSYADAYALQVAHHEEVLTARDAGEGDHGRILLVEHVPPVITISRRQEAAQHLLAGRELLAKMGVEVQETDRGGDITYHGPGQLVVYPILDLNFYKLRLHDYMRFLEDAVIATVGAFGLTGRREAGATGVWVDSQAFGTSAKICAMGVRIRRWVSMHGLALNVTTNLRHFDLIVPCGLTGRPVTTLEREGVVGDSVSLMTRAKAELSRVLVKGLDDRLDAEDHASNTLGPQSLAE